MRAIIFLLLTRPFCVMSSENFTLFLKFIDFHPLFLKQFFYLSQLSSKKAQSNNFFRDKLMVQKMLTYDVKELVERVGMDKFSLYWIPLLRFIYFFAHTDYLNGTLPSIATLFIWPMQCNLNHAFTIDCTYTCELSSSSSFFSFLISVTAWI